MNKYSVEEIIKGVKHRNNNVFRHLYQDIYPSVQQMVLLNKGSEEDARDIFQEALIVFYRNACKQGFKLNASVKTYLYSVCRNIWMSKQTKDTINIDDVLETNEPEMQYEASDNDFLTDDVIDDSLKLGLIQKHFSKLERFCQKILQLFIKGNVHQDIAKKMKLTLEASRNRRKLCLKKLTKLITADAEYKRLYGSRQ